MRVVSLTAARVIPVRHTRVRKAPSAFPKVALSMEMVGPLRVPGLSFLTVACCPIHARLLLAHVISSLNNREANMTKIAAAISAKLGRAHSSQEIRTGAGRRTKQGRPMNTFVVLSSGILLAVALVTQSDARPHNNQLRPTRAEVFYHTPGYNLELSQRALRGRDSSCHNVPGLPDMFACSAN